VEKEQRHAERAANRPVYASAAGARPLSLVVPWEFFVPILAFFDVQHCWEMFGRAAGILDYEMRKGIGRVMVIGQSDEQVLS
jgi:hypothetical protein